MHPFGGTPVCPRCNKAVYAAEQVMGPGRKLYHKPCLACTACGKRLDSLTLLEHDQMPYCKTCHVRTFGIRDLRQANLPHREDLPPSPVPASPAHFGTASLVNVGSTSPARAPTGGLHSPVRADFTGISGTTPLLRANSSLPTRFNRVSPTDPPPELTSTTEEAAEDGRLEKVEEQEGTCTTVTTSTANIDPSRDTQFSRSTSSSTLGAIMIKESDSTLPVQRPASPLKPNSTGFSTATNISPLKPTSTGIRYGMALGGINSSPTKSWGLGGATPVCPRCGKNVYFAEQMKAIGKTWHKGCLRCSSCSTLLDSKRLNEKDGEPLCGRCYSKLHGPHGSGYALLGKAGG